MAQPIIQLQEVNKEFGKGKNTVAALKDVNLDINKGEFVAIVGPSGCGKSTLLHVMAGLEQPTAGRILLAAEEVFAEHGFSGATTREIAKRAGVNIANIHYYWGSKDGLWQAVIYNVIIHTIELSNSLTEFSADNLEDGLKIYIERIIDIFADNPNYARIFQYGSLKGYSEEVAKSLALPLLSIGLKFIDDIENVGGKSLYSWKFVFQGPDQSTRC